MLKQVQHDDRSNIRLWSTVDRLLSAKGNRPLNDHKWRKEAMGDVDPTRPFQLAAPDDQSISQ